MHSLSLDINRKTTCDKLTIQDTSWYDPLYPVENPILEVMSPISTCFSVFTLTHPWCLKTLTCQDLSICYNEQNGTILPDGNYIIKYSIDPNLSTMVEFNHFRVCNIMKNLILQICKFLSERCNMSLSEQKAEKERLLDIESIINYSVYASEECLDIEEAKRLYNEANKKLNESGDCPTCK